MKNISKYRLDGKYNNFCSQVWTIAILLLCFFNAALFNKLVFMQEDIVRERSIPLLVTVIGDLCVLYQIPQFIRKVSHRDNRHIFKKYMPIISVLMIAGIMRIPIFERMIDFAVC